MPTSSGIKAPAMVTELREQAEQCSRLGSSLYAYLLNRAADDVDGGGPTGEVLRGFGRDIAWTGPALRLMGSVHRLVLEGSAPDLAQHYPSVGGDGKAEPAWKAFRQTMVEQRGSLRLLMERPVQTNEVTRSAALVGGFLLVAKHTGLPLRLLEVGASAGLNLRWDHFRYEATADWGWGDPESPVRLTGMFTGGRLPFDVECRVTDRRGCDVHPLDATSEEGQLTLMSYVWADQVDRLGLLRGAFDVASRVPAPVEEAPATDWLSDELRNAERGVATVVFHSVVWPYLADEDREGMGQQLRRAGARATRDAPLAWLLLEPGGAEMEVRLTLWPGGKERLLATSGAHGRPLRWLL